MKRAAAAVLAAGAMLCSAVGAESAGAYSSTKVGEWVPPAPPAKEVTHLEGLGLREGEKLPFPADKVKDIAPTMFIEMKGDGSGSGGGEPARVPHNWFGSGKFLAPKYSIATGKQECDVCKYMIGQKRASADVDYDAKAGAEAASKTPAGAASGFGCESISPVYKDMCNGYSQYLDQCPSFVHNICHEDVGGSEKLRSPCPEHLQCYYCLRINPLYCVEE